MRHVLLNLPATFWAYLDVLVVALATVLTYRTLLHNNADFEWVANPWLSGTVFSVCIVLSGLVFGLYEQHTLGARSRILVRCALTLIGGLTLAYAVISLLFYEDMTRWLGLSIGVMYVLVAIPLRIAAHAAVTGLRVRVLCIGSGESIRRAAQLLATKHRPRYTLVGRVDPALVDEARPQVAADRDFERACPYLGSVTETGRIVAEHSIDEVIVDSAVTGDPAVGTAVLACLDQRCRVTDQPTFIETLLGEVPAANITAQWFLLADVTASSSFEAIKRIMDLIVAGLGLLLTLPLWPLIAVLIRLDSRGPAIFRQQRVGLHGRPFCIYKFRTMRIDAERGGPRWADKHDVRVTRFGRFLRQSRLDELPQLWNILRGDMSLVGPRPERPEFVEQLAEAIPHYRQRHLIKPGLTGWAQIRYGYGASVEDSHRKLCYDLYYLKHRSIDLDTAIMIRTLGRFVLGAR